MTPARGSGSRRGPAERDAKSRAHAAEKGAKGAGKKGAKPATRKGAKAAAKHDAKPAAKKRAKPAAKDGAKAAGKGAKPAARGKSFAALNRSSNARVVWPPQARTETAREAIEQMLREAGLARRFEPAVEHEARNAAQRAWSEAEAQLRDGRRRDLRELPTLTVDPATARDFDDAISAERLPDGTVRVWVHIADVAAHVPRGSLIDLEALKRATSTYVPGTVEPMLPHALSSDACSLVPGVERLAVTVELTLRGATVESSGFYRSLVRSNMRLDYEQVDHIFAGNVSAREPWGAPLAAARDAAAELQRARESRGALVIDSAEPEFSFDEHGNVSSIRPRAQTESHRLIEHLMIAANEAVARQLTQASAPCLYRVHERPDPERIRKLVAQLATLGVPTPPLPDPLFPAQAAELVGEISRRVDAHVRQTGQGRIALSSLVLRSLKQAFYSPKNLGHAGLRAAYYCHFTSPIRRYPDLVCHRALLACIGADEHARRRGGARKLVELGEWTSERERDAARLEHKGDDIAACFLLERALIDGGHEQVFRGEITGMIAAGAFVAFGDLPREGVRVREDTAGEGPVSDSPSESPGGVGLGGEGPGGNGPGGVGPSDEGSVSERPDPRALGTGVPETSLGLLYEGMLPVRLLSAGEERDWWALNDQSTILRGERSGATLRLGDSIDVRVVRIDASAGRVDLAPAG
jgi:ribonuclease R